MKKECLGGFLLFVFLEFAIANPTWASGPNSKTFNLPEMAGWKQSGEVQTFLPRTLFEYINGAADLYLTYDFQELKVAEYINDQKSSLTVEIYRHGTPVQAFGIYSQERLSNSNFVHVGTQGYRENDILNVLAGPYYVKISSFKIRPEDQEILLTLAKKLVENLGEKGPLPEILSFFPEAGKVKNSEKFTAVKFLGYAFLHFAFTAEYEIPGNKFRLFIIEGADTNDCREMVQKYLKQAKNPEDNIKEGPYTLSDPYNGEIELHWKGKYIWGTLDAKDPDLRSKYLRQFEETFMKSE